MLELVPQWLGASMRSIRAGHAKLALLDSSLGVTAPSLDLSSPAFPHNGRLPVRFTADGEGVSPPLVWGPLPAGTQSLALIVEDPDAPAPAPLIHALIWGLPAGTGRLAEGVFTQGGEPAVEGEVGRNSFFGHGWLPPDPPTGHGSHDYVFQLFALDLPPGELPSVTRGAMIDAMAGHVLGAGMLVGTYSRGEETRGEGADAVTVGQPI